MTLKQGKLYATLNTSIGGKNLKKGDAIYVQEVVNDTVSVYIGESAIGALIHAPICTVAHAFSETK